LLKIINGRVAASPAMVSGPAKGLGSDARFLEQLAEEIRKDLAAT
jgi:hypothetical protein